MSVGDLKVTVSVKAPHSMCGWMVTHDLRNNTSLELLAQLVMNSVG